MWSCCAKHDLIVSGVSHHSACIPGQLLQHLVPRKPTSNNRQDEDVAAAGCMHTQGGSRMSLIVVCLLTILSGRQIFLLIMLCFQLNLYAPFSFQQNNLYVMIYIYIYYHYNHAIYSPSCTLSDNVTSILWHVTIQSFEPGATLCRSALHYTSWLLHDLWLSVTRTRWC